MNDTKKTIELATTLIKENHDCLNPSLLYPFATENLVGVFQNINVSGKECLTINGSFDQSLDMALFGAKSITAFDMNPLTIPYADLKKALITTGYKKEIYQAFLAGYFDTLEQYAYHPKILKYCEKNLEESSFLFWKEILNEFTKKEIGTKLFCEVLPYFELSNFINYLQEKNYYKLQQKLSNTEIEIKEGNIETFANTLQKKYDIMYFSNIIGYPNSIYEEKKQEEKLNTYKELIHTYSNFLNDNGKIISYLYDPENSQSCEDIPIYNKELREEIFKGPEYSYIYFPGYFSDSKDSCLIYTKTQK